MLLSTGAVAFGIISLLPVELILQVGSGAGFAMVFALLVAAIIWNLGTWWFGLPSSSSHTLIGSIIGVGIANQLMAVKTGTSGVDWGQAGNIGKSLLISPLVGFVCAGAAAPAHEERDPRQAALRGPEGTAPPPFWIRALLVLTCTGVSFAHGSNDGQKGMGLIMLILIGTVPTAYALNHAVTAQRSRTTSSRCRRRRPTCSTTTSPNAVVGRPARRRSRPTSGRSNFTPSTMLALRQIVNDIANEMRLVQRAEERPSAERRELPQRHVPDQRSVAPDSEVGQPGISRRRLGVLE